MARDLANGAKGGTWFGGVERDALRRSNGVWLDSGVAADEADLERALRTGGELSDFIRLGRALQLTILAPRPAPSSISARGSGFRS